MTDKRKLIYDYAIEHDGKITTAEANNLLKGFYYCNHEHYVSEILSRLVKSNVFVRLRKGHFAVNSAYHSKSKGKNLSVSKEQIKLF